MAHDLFSSLDFLVSGSAADVALMVRDVAGDYRLADADEVLLAAQRLLAGRVRGDVDPAHAGGIHGWGSGIQNNQQEPLLAASP